MNPKRFGDLSKIVSGKGLIVPEDKLAHQVISGDENVLEWVATSTHRGNGRPNPETVAITVAEIKRRGLVG